MDPTHNFEDVMKEHFARLPTSIQNAITSADVEAHLRELAKTHQLHLDQWDLLENEVMLSLLGVQKTTQLKNNIVKEVGVSPEIAAVLATDIAQYVFHPIREELERQLEHPEAQTATVSDVDTVRTQTLLTEHTPPQPIAVLMSAATPAIAPSPSETPSQPPIALSPAASVVPPAPQAALTSAPSSGEKAVRADASATYISRVPSHERKMIEGDPYREQIN